MLSSSQWLELKHFTPANVPDPEKMQFPILKALDQFTDLIGAAPVFLDTWRPPVAGAPAWHSQGIAVDVAYPGRDPLEVLKLAESSGFFDGIGLYRNEKGAASFHFDTRGYRARWGAEITHPVDPDTGRTVQKNSYTTLEKIVALFGKKKVLLTGGAAALILIALLLLLKKR